MDREGFRELLQTRKLNEDQIEASIAMAERFEEYLGAQAEAPDAISTWKFCKTLIQEGKNTYDNLLAIGRYGLFIKNNAIYVAILEVLDGAEVQPNLYQKVGTLFGERVRDEVFAGIGVSPMGLPPAEKPFDMFPVLDRLISKLGYEQVEILLSACLRDLPEEYYLDDREKYFQLANIDEYLRYKHQSLVKRLETCQQEGKLFFSQEINDDVVQYVREHPETESGVRQGNVLFISKIPYDTIRFLGESNLTLKRYYACHCPWVRHAIKQGNINLNPVFCNCSGGFSKRPWEVIFGQTLKMEVLESVLLGDLRCRFAVYLPEKAESIQVT
jgi:hypothetical protein